MNLAGEAERMEKEKTGDNVSRRLLQWSKCAVTRVRMQRMQGTLERKNWWDSVTKRMCTGLLVTKDLIPSSPARYPNKVMPVGSTEQKFWIWACLSDSKGSLLCCLLAGLPSASFNLPELSSFAKHIKTYFSGMWWRLNDYIDNNVECWQNACTTGRSQ